MDVQILRMLKASQAPRECCSVASCRGYDATRISSTLGGETSSLLSHIQNEIQSRLFSTGWTHSRLRRVRPGLRKAPPPTHARRRRTPAAAAHSHPVPLDRDRRPGVHDRAGALLARVSAAALAPVRRCRAFGADQSRAVVRLRRDHASDRAQRGLAAGLRHPAAGVSVGADRRIAEPVLDPADRAGDAFGDHAVAAHDGGALFHGDRRRQLARPVSERSTLATRARSACRRSTSAACGSPWF